MPDNADLNAVKMQHKGGAQTMFEMQEDTRGKQKHLQVDAEE